jgi:hypothetical protein
VPPRKAAGARKRKPAPAKRTQVSKAERLERQKQRRALRWRLTAVIVLLLGLALFVVLNRGGEDDAAIAEVEASGACAYDTRTDEDPPSDGDVDDVEPAEPSFYEPDDELPSDLSLIRAMRQGFVVLWFDPETPVDEVHPLSDRFGRDLIVVPRPGMTTPIAVTAWKRRALCASIDQRAIAAFVDGFRDRAPEKGFL